MSKARESDLTHDADPVRFGRAIVKCEGFGPDCSFTGRCMLAGQCFAAPAHLVAARMIERLLPVDGRPGMHFAYLRQCAEMLRADRVAL